jgi:hypothetical protein
VTVLIPQPKEGDMVRSSGSTGYIDNEAIFKRILDDEEFREVLMDLYAARVYRQARDRPDIPTEAP